MVYGPGQASRKKAIQYTVYQYRNIHRGPLSKREEVGMNQFSRNLDNVSDPSDFNQSKLPALSQLDSLQRCFICKEFLKAPVSTSCNHTFCSHCIREYLVVHNHCPLCETEQFESNLRRIILLEEIVSCYASLRPHLLELVQDSAKMGGDPSNKLKRTFDVANDEPIEVFSDSDGSRDGSAAPDPVKKAKNSPTIPSDPVVKKIKNSPTISNRKHEEIKQENDREPTKSLAESSQHTVPTRQDMVACPICSQTMTAEKLQAEHIDDCLSGKSTVRKSQSPATSSSLQKKRNSPNVGISSFFQPIKSKRPNSPPRINHEDFYFNQASNHNQQEVKRLPKLDFNSLTTPKLKEKLSSLKIPTQGSRYQLELRYNHYYILFNSNLDSNHPVPEKILKQKLNQWELSHSAFTSSTSSTSSLFSTRNSISNKAVTDKDFSVKLWMDTYRKEFKDLVKQAKKSAKKQCKDKAETATGPAADPVATKAEAENAAGSAAEDATTAVESAADFVATNAEAEKAGPEFAATNAEADNATGPAAEAAAPTAGVASSVEDSHNTAGKAATAKPPSTDVSSSSTSEQDGEPLEFDFSNSSLFTGEK